MKRNFKLEVDNIPDYKTAVSSCLIFFIKLKNPNKIERFDPHKVDLLSYEEKLEKQIKIYFIKKN